MQKTLSILAAAALLAGGAYAQCNQLSYSGTSNGQKGTMFEIVNLSASNPLNIGYFEQAFLAAGTANIEIYTLVGSCAGLETNAGAWTLIGSANGVAHGVSPQLDLIPISLNLTIPPSGVQSFYITTTAATASNVRYSTGTTGQYGQQYASNADLALVGRTGMSYPFGSNFGVGTTGRLWNGRVNYGPACQGSFASSASIGAGCTTSFGSVYESHTAFDLSNTSLSFTFVGNQYLLTPGTTAIATQASAPVAMGDDQVLQFPLGFSMPYAGGTTSDVWVSSNGFINLTTNATNGCCAFNLAQFLTNGPTFAAKWDDLNPGAGGTVQFDSDPVNGVAYVTFTAVPDFGSTVDLNDFQYVLFQNGNVELRFGTVAPTAGGTGYSPGTGNLDPGTTDLSAIAAPVLTGVQALPLTVANDVRPIISSVVTFTSGNVPTTAPFGAILLGLTNPTLDLTSIGMAGCTQYTDGMVTTLFLPLGNTSVATPITMPAFAGLPLFAQSVVYDPASGRTALGAIASNGIQMLTGNL